MQDYFFLVEGVLGKEQGFFNKQKTFARTEEFVLFEQLVRKDQADLHFLLETLLLETLR